MSNAIKVGDKVKRSSWTCVYTVLALDDKGLAWIQTENSTLGMIVHLSTLTRIEPEKVTPKYAVGEKVRLKNDALDFPGEVGRVIHLGYYVSRTGYWGVWVAESKLEPVPTPCPTCKGSGKSEGVT